MAGRTSLETKCIDIYTRAFKGLFLVHTGRYRRFPSGPAEWAPFLLEVLFSVKQEHPYPVKHAIFEKIHEVMCEGVENADPQALDKWFKTLK